MKKIVTILMLLIVSSCNDTNKYDNTYNVVEEYNPLNDSMLIKLQNKVKLINKQDSGFIQLKHEHQKDSIKLCEQNTDIINLEKSLKQKPKEIEIIKIIPVKVFKSYQDSISTPKPFKYKKMTTIPVIDTIVIHDTVYKKVLDKKNPKTKRLIRSKR